MEQLKSKFFKIKPLLLTKDINKYGRLTPPIYVIYIYINIMFKEENQVMRNYNVDQKKEKLVKLHSWIFIWFRIQKKRERSFLVLLFFFFFVSIKEFIAFFYKH